MGSATGACDQPTIRNIIQQRGRSHFRTRARPLDQQRLQAIAITMDGDAVVGARALRQGMVGRKLTQAHLCTLGINAANETQHTTIVARLLPARLQRRIQLLERRHRILQRQRCQRVRHQ